MSMKIFKILLNKIWRKDFTQKECWQSIMNLRKSKSEAYYFAMHSNDENHEYEQIKNANNEILREYQDIFPSQRSCLDEICTLRILLGARIK